MFGVTTRPTELLKDRGVFLMRLSLLLHTLLLVVTAGRILDKDLERVFGLGGGAPRVKLQADPVDRRREPHTIVRHVGSLVRVVTLRPSIVLQQQQDDTSGNPITYLMLG